MRRGPFKKSHWARESRAAGVTLDSLSGFWVDFSSLAWSTFLANAPRSTKWFPSWRYAWQMRVLLYMHGRRFARGKMEQGGLFIRAMIEVSFETHVEPSFRETLVRHRIFFWLKWRSIELNTHLRVLCKQCAESNGTFYVQEFGKFLMILGIKLSTKDYKEPKPRKLTGSIMFNLCC
jgi:hypothetical protein